MFLDGTTVRSVSPDDDGLVVTSATAGSTVQGLSIGNFGGAAVSLGSDANTVRGNFVGVLADGSTTAPNVGGGVRMDGVAQNTIGGPAVADGNVIAGNTDAAGVKDAGGRTNTISHNVVGLDATGEARASGAANGNGIELASAGTDRVENNVVSGNDGNGVQITAGGMHTIAGNEVGLDVTGEDQFGNGLAGIAVTNSPDNVIGGSLETDRNVISANTAQDILISGNSSNRNQVLGNYVGGDAAGVSGSLPGVNPGDPARSFGNGGQGIEIRNAQRTIVGAVGEGNAIGLNGAANQADGAGIAVYGSSSTFTRIQANLVGLSPNGDEHMGNGGHGILIESAPGVVIGGAGLGEGNVVVDSGRGLRCCSPTTSVGAGIRVTGAPDARIKGNKIGTVPGPSGGSGFPNLGDGISILDSTNTAIGGSESGAQNLISANLGFGVLVSGPATAGTTILGNRIGTTSDGTGGLGNGVSGIAIQDGARDTVIGGSEARAPNLISANKADGIETGGGASNVVVAGNVIGLERSGVSQLPNAGSGIAVGGRGMEIRDNVISGNGVRGVAVGAAAGDTVIRHNAIGVNEARDSAIANNGRGIEVFAGAQDTTIGGDRVDDGNLISGNAGAAVLAGADGTKVLGNRIGTDKTGERPIPNRAGVSVAAANVMVGSLEDSRGNVVAFNNDAGVTVEPTGTDATIAGNVISGNGADGLTDTGSGTRVLGNFIGTDRVGGRWVGNHDNGVVLAGAGATVGTPIAGEGNQIAFNGSDGVAVFGIAGNRITGNSIHDNALLGIAAADIRNFPELSSADSGPGATTVTGVLHGAPTAAFTVDVYASPAADDSGYGEGAEYLGSVQVSTDASGVAPFTLTVGRAVRGVVSATTTGTAGDTSEFSRAIAVTFTPARPLASVLTTTAAPTSATAARIGGTVTPAEGPTTVFAEYAASGSPTCEGAAAGGLQRTAAQALPDSEDRARSVAVVLAGLSGSTSYCVRLSAQSAGGTAHGDFVSFSTNAAPAVTPPTPPGPSAARVVATLKGALAVTGKAGEMDAILSGGGYATRFGAPSAGRIVVRWYATPRGAKKPVLIAEGRATAASAGRIVVFVKLTSAGKRALRAARKPLKVTAKATFTMAGRTPVTTTRRLELRP